MHLISYMNLIDSAGIPQGNINDFKEFCKNNKCKTKLKYKKILAILVIMNKTYLTFTVYDIYLSR